MNLISLTTLSIFISLNLIDIPFCQENSSSDSSADFNVGMFSVVGNIAGSPQPGTQEFRDELHSLWYGTNDGYHPINILHTYGHYIEDTNFWTNYLNDINLVSDSLKTLGDCRFIYVDTNQDSIISQDELNIFNTLFESLLTTLNADHIAGWYIADEPTSHEYEPTELQKIYDAIKQRDSRPIYIAEAPGELDYSRFSCDVLMIDDYYYSVNGYTDLGTLAWWKDLIYSARQDLRNAGKENTKIQAILVLGEEFFPDTLNENLVATHGLTHSAIKTVLQQGVDGVWFYAWRAGTIFTDDAVDRWLTQQYYAEAVETEIHDRDYLVTAFNNQSGSKIYISDVGNGQAPDEGINFTFNSLIIGVTSGDYQGSKNLNGNPVLFDLSYRTDEGYRSNGDGDDELITAFNNGEVFFNENGIQPDQLLIGSATGNVLAITSGDYDGDGDDEIVTALLNGSQCAIYVSDDAAVGSIMQYQLYTSDIFKVTALTSGDLNEDGRDELVTALSNSQLTESYIYIDDIASTGTVGNGNPWYGPDNIYHITALAVGDFNEDNYFKDRLVFAFSDSSLLNTKLYYTALNSFSFDSSQVFFGPDNYWHVTAMSAGDFLDDNQLTEDLIISFSNSSLDHTQIYNTNDPEVNGIGTLIYDQGYPSTYYVSSFTSASFRESLHPITSIDDQNTGDKSIIPKDIILYQNYPNPFNPITKIEFRIWNTESVSLKVYDILGNQITMLVDAKIPAGNYEVEFDATNFPSGVYFYQLCAGYYTKTKKMILLK